MNEKHQNHVFERRIIYYWFMILFATIMLAVSIFTLWHNITVGRNMLSREAEFVRLGLQLGYASNLMSIAAQKYVITGNPRHLRNYWYEVDIAQQRPKAVAKLKILQAPENEMDLINQSKNNSDNLILREVRAMKLVQLAYGVPESAMHPAVRAYKLSAEERTLTPSEKINMGRKLVFNEKYEKYKNQVIDPLLEFQKVMKARVKIEKTQALRATNLNLTVTILLTIAITILILSIIWMRFLSLYPDEPEKPAHESDEAAGASKSSEA